RQRGKQMTLPKEFRAWTRGFGCIPHVAGVAAVVRWRAGQAEWEVIHAEASGDLHAAVQGFVGRGMLFVAVKGPRAAGAVARAAGHARCRRRFPLGFRSPERPP